jgi:hypothetical protein
METKYLVILLIIVSIGGGLFFFQKDKQKKNLQDHKINQLRRITKAANKSMPAGMITMATAINKFNEVKGNYPINLLKLYPEFIPEKSFILKVNWKYRPEKNDYLLQKSIGKSQTLVSIGPDLKIQTGDYISSQSTEMVASVDKAKTSIKTGKKSTASKTGQVKPAVRMDSDNDQLAKLVPPNLIKIPENINIGEERKTTKFISLSNIVRKKLSKKEKFLLSLNSDNFYIWKSKDGTLGFSNMQYPNEKNLAIYYDQSWIEYKGNSIRQ